MEVLRGFQNFKGVYSGHPAINQHSKIAIFRITKEVELNKRQSPNLSSCGQDFFYIFLLLLGIQSPE